MKSTFELTRALRKKLRRGYLFADNQKINAIKFYYIQHAVVKSIKNKQKRDHWLDHADEKYDKSLIEDIKSLFRVLVLFVPLPVFWALFDQQVFEKHILEHSYFILK